MQQISYTVRATFPDQATRDRYVSWLTPAHTALVLAAGATKAQVVVLDKDDSANPANPANASGPANAPGQTNPPGQSNPSPGWSVEARYQFPSRHALQQYTSIHAPALRADGLRHFGPETGVVFVRSIGVIVE